MRTTKYLLFAGLGIAAVILLTSDRAREIREDIEDNAKKNAKKWKQKLANIGNETSDTLADLKNMLSCEIEGLSDDARERIEHILNDTTKTADKIKSNVSKQLS
jgi:gas vesicle protein